MTSANHWNERGVWQRGGDVGKFISEYLASQDRRLLLVAGAGFDPRSTIICEHLAQATSRIRGVFLREERPIASGDCSTRGDANAALLQLLVPESRVETIAIFAEDGAVIGGRKAALMGNHLDIADITDVIVDFSALSKGGVKRRTEMSQNAP